MKTVGTLYGIGVGPGEPEWLTLKARRLLQEVPVVAYPKSCSAATSYALNIVERFLNPSRQTLVGLSFPMTGHAEERQEARAQAARQLGEILLSGQDVAWITEGDPLLYSTFIHVMKEIERENPAIPVEIVPGISSINGAAAQLKLPLVDGDERLAVVPASDNRQQMKALLDTFDTVVFLKVAKVLDRMVDLLEELNRLDSAWVATKVSSGEERLIHDVRRLKGEKLPYFTLMVVKKEAK